ncbi:MAG: hypothetical protein ABR600_11860 [Actinomycetota bacterium]
MSSSAASTPRSTAASASTSLSSATSAANDAVRAMYRGIRASGNVSRSAPWPVEATRKSSTIAIQDATESSGPCPASARPWASSTAARDPSLRTSCQITRWRRNPSSNFATSRSIET